MAKNLVIVESPAKAKTIGKLLGADFVVKSSVGHIRDLPERELGVDIEHDFKPKYVISTNKKKVVEDLRLFERRMTARCRRPADRGRLGRCGGLGLGGIGRHDA